MEVPLNPRTDASLGMSGCGDKQTAPAIAPNRENAAQDGHVLAQPLRKGRF